MLLYIDTSALIALAVPSDANHGAATTYFRESLEEGSRFILGRPILVEYIDGVTKRVSKREAIRHLRALESSRVTRIEPETEEDHRQARKLFARYDDHPIDLTDSISFSMMNRLQLPDVFTFDRDFKIHGFVCYP